MSMTRLVLLATSLVMVVPMAQAQTRPTGPAPANQAVHDGAAGAAARMQAQGFSDIHDLRKGPDGKWTGEAMRNGVPSTVTAEPDGRLTAR
jgi:hypothetical protein